MYAYGLLKYTKIKFITHRFFVKVHTQNEEDFAYSVIKRQVKRSLKSGPIYLAAEYVGVIKMPRKVEGLTL